MKDFCQLAEEFGVIEKPLGAKPACAPVCRELTDGLQAEVELFTRLQR